jgi:hypothetical protein
LFGFEGVCDAFVDNLFIVSSLSFWSLMLVGKKDLYLRVFEKGTFEV